MNGIMGFIIAVLLVIFVSGLISGMMITKDSE